MRGTPQQLTGLSLRARANFIGNKGEVKLKTHFNCSIPHLLIARTCTLQLDILRSELYTTRWYVRIRLRLIISCVLENFCEIFVSKTEFCHCNRSCKIKSVWICTICCGNKFCCRDKDFHKKFSNTHEAICRSNMSRNLPPDLYTKCVLSLWCVAATCHLLCPDLQWHPRLWSIQQAQIWIKTVFLTNQKLYSDLGSQGLFLRCCLRCEMSAVFSGYELWCQSASFLLIMSRYIYLFVISRVLL